MGQIHLFSDKELPIFSYRVCLQCGLKTLVYSNGLCRRCILLMKIQWTVAAHKKAK